MRIGLVFTMRKTNGGAYQYALTFLDALKNNRRHQYFIFNFTHDLPEEYKKFDNFEVIEMTGPPPSPPHEEGRKGRSKFVRTKILLHNILLRLHLFSLLKSLTKLSQKNTLEKILSKKLDLIIFTMSHKLAFLLDIPTIVPIHDLQHRLNPQFPEVSSGKIWLEREYLYSQITERAWRILVDSQIGKEDVLKYYKIDPKKIEILPFLPPNYLSSQINESSHQEFLAKLPRKFLFYPAQLWPHKNHENIIHAMGLLKKNGQRVDIVLSGSKKEKWNTFDYLMKLASNLGVRDQIHYLGFVSNEEMSLLYKKSTALIMATFFGPSNIPILEAWKLGCPVLYSDIRGCREQAGDAALLFDPTNAEDIAKKIQQIWTDENLRQDLISKGTARLNLWTPEMFGDKINKVINQFQHG